MILPSCHNMHHKNLIQSNFVLKYTLSVFRGGRRGEESIIFIDEDIEQRGMLYTYIQMLTVMIDLIEW